MRIVPLLMKSEFPSAGSNCIVQQGENVNE